VTGGDRAHDPPGRAEPWRAAAALAALGVAAVFLALPRPLSPALFAFAAPLAAALAVSGAILGWSAGLGAPLLDALLHGRPAGAPAWRALASGVASGFALGAAMLLALRVLLIPAMPALGARLAAEVSLPASTRWLIAFDAAVLEELLYRLFLVSGLVVALRRLSTRPGRLSPEGTIRIAVAVSALLFAAAHLPRWTQITGGAPWLVLAAVLLLNAIGGAVFGIVYVRRGIEAAMLAHFAADVVLHVIGPWFTAARPGVPV
jgi:hypothetical protein